MEETLQSRVLLGIWVTVLMLQLYNEDMVLWWISLDLKFIFPQIRFDSADALVQFLITSNFFLSLLLLQFLVQSSCCYSLFPVQFPSQFLGAWL